VDDDRGRPPGLVVRPIEPTDAERLVRFHGTLSAETTRLRYFSPHPRLSDVEVARFTTVDHRDREALVALLGDEIVGVARYDRHLGTDVAEAAFVITDAWHGHGIGSWLLGQLADLARERGITRLLALVLPENQAMLNLARGSGFPARRHYADGALHVELDISEPAPPPDA
jgi:GNAT superfamily N-acetyltransferase